MKATIIRWIHKEEAAIAPYAAGAALSVALYAESALTTAHPSGQLDVALVMLGSFGVKALIVLLRKRAAVAAPPA